MIEHTVKPGENATIAGVAIRNAGTCTVHIADDFTYAFSREEGTFRIEILDPRPIRELPPALANGRWYA